MYILRPRRKKEDVDKMRGLRKRFKRNELQVILYVVLASVAAIVVGVFGFMLVGQTTIANPTPEVPEPPPEFTIDPILIAIIAVVIIVAFTTLWYSRSGRRRRR